MQRIFGFDALPVADLVVDAIYEGGGAANSGSDPIAKLLPGAGNQGGFRPSGSGARKNFVVLYSSGADGDWPDRLNLATGQFTYYGDNKTPGSDLHATKRGGNLLLQAVFEQVHGDAAMRSLVPPFLVFTKSPTSNSSRSVQFKGLAVPGFPGLSMTEDLVAVWKSTEGKRFQNYRSVFTILNVATVPRTWLSALSRKEYWSAAAPSAWQSWVETGVYKPLTSEPQESFEARASSAPIHH